MVHPNTFLYFSYVVPNNHLYKISLSISSNYFSYVVHPNNHLCKISMFMNTLFSAFMLYSYIVPRPSKNDLTLFNVEQLSLVKIELF